MLVEELKEYFCSVLGSECLYLDAFMEHFILVRISSLLIFHIGNSEILLVLKIKISST